MDLDIYYDFEPEHLEPKELLYEIQIRNMTGYYETARDETKTLRKVLLRERNGLDERPTGRVSNVLQELNDCQLFLKTISDGVQRARSKMDSMALVVLKSRVASWLNRMCRICDKQVDGYEDCMAELKALWELVDNVGKSKEMARVIVVDLGEENVESNGVNARHSLPLDKTDNVLSNLNRLSLGSQISSKGRGTGFLRQNASLSQVNLVGQDSRNKIGDNSTLFRGAISKTNMQKFGDETTKSYKVGYGEPSSRKNIEKVNVDFHSDN